MKNNTRWLSEYRAIASYLSKDQKQVEAALRAFDPQKRLALTDPEQDSLRDLVTIIEPLNMAIMNAQREKSVTISYVVPTILRLFNIWIEMLNAKQTELNTRRRTHNIDVVKAFLGSLCVRFRKLFEYMDIEDDASQYASKKRVSEGMSCFGDPVLFASSTLDPKFCGQWFEDIPGEQRRTRIRDKVKRFIIDEANMMSSDLVETNDSRANINSELQNNAAPNKDLFSKYRTAPSEPRMMASCNRELDGKSARNVYGRRSRRPTSVLGKT
jgi:hypothetical protein